MLRTDLRLVNVSARRGVLPIIPNRDPADFSKAQDFVGLVKLTLPLMYKVMQESARKEWRMNHAQGEIAHDVSLSPDSTVDSQVTKFERSPSAASQHSFNDLGS